MKIPPFDTCWWSGLDIIEDQLDWLTISVECAPYRYVCNLSTVHTIARAFLSGVSDLLTYATIRWSFCPGVHCAENSCELSFFAFVR